ncbi:MAG: 7-keto-8-aminopelargonate synthetase [Gammaproteobacteria bacterium]|jgi:7-keto-8-aminopelargonate synthetase-like enzyme|nr:7-keto-8-aminopelargonate synthetase [Gammaproteobacteria bacterium]
MKGVLNINKLIKISEPSWSFAKNEGLIDLAVSYDISPYMFYKEHRFINMCSCSYLGLDTNPQILEGAIEGIKRAKSLHLTTARLRLYITMLGDLEEALSEHYSCEATAYISCSAASSAYLPLLASGMLTNDSKPTMIFDKQAHFSMIHIKPICADQTDVLTCEHNDIDYIETVCKRNSNVVYVGDGTYSVAGHAPIKELLRLQEKYGLTLYLDDSHGLSVTGKLGEGYIRENIPELNSKIVIVGSLAKAFGACGGVLMSGNKGLKDMLVRYGNSWSQYLNSAGIGGIMASLQIHRSEQLKRLQDAWWRNLQILDSRFNTTNKGVKTPIRIILLKSPEKAVEIAKRIFEKGYYVSAVFFPIVPQGKAGLRIMPRADVNEDEMTKFCDTVFEVCEDDLSS